MKNSSFQVLRTDLSSYQQSDFVNNERETLTKEFPFLTYYTDQSQLSLTIPTILITNTHTSIEKIDPKILNNSPLIIHPNSGFDNFSPEFIKKFNAPIILGNSIRAPIVTEYILSALLNSHCLINSEQTWRINRAWNRDLIFDKRILLIGLGTIGKMIAPILNQLSNKNLRIYDPFIDPTPFTDYIFLKNKNECKNFDIIIVCASLTKSSYHFIDQKFLENQNKTILLINSSRGQIVNELELINYLKNNSENNCKIYLDVFEKEPNDFKQFKNFPEITCTSHIAGVCKTLNQKIIDFELKTLKDFFTSLKDTQEFKNRYKLINLKEIYNELH